jgi:hypothetical protein
MVVCLGAKIIRKAIEDSRYSYFINRQLFKKRRPGLRNPAFCTPIARNRTSLFLPDLTLREGVQL